MLDADGFRPNVGIVVANSREEVLFARRVGGFDAWQFPQGGIQESETPKDALYRELDEEVGLDAACVEIIAETRGWLRYELPPQLRRRSSHPNFVGQKQKWFLLRMLADDSQVDVHRCDEPEFDHWQWVSYWHPITKVVAFKRNVYRQALAELVPALGALSSAASPSANRAD